MKFLKRLIIIVLLLILFINITTIAKFFFPLKYPNYINKYSTEYNLDKYFVMSVIKAESNFEKDAISHKNAKGLMQLTPDTAYWIAKKMKISDFDIEKLNDPETNIKMGCWYLNDLRKEFGENMDIVLAAYNGGRGNVNRWLKNKQNSQDGQNLHYIPFKETDKYIKKVKVNYNMYKFLYKK